MSSRRLSTKFDSNAALDVLRASTGVNKRQSLAAMRKSMAAGRASGADEESAAQKFSDPALKEMYSTVIKLSTENKINAKNTWSFDFIERMDDMIAADDSGMGGMTNFQKASCTLDASVKLYSYRVDDVWSSSFRVLENLSRRPEGGPSDSDAGSAATKQRRRAGGSGSTLESNPAAITLSEGGEGAAMDPLFHKMSKTFDAGGAGGLLLHNLPVQRGAALDLTGGAPLPALATDPALATAAVDPAGAEAAGSAVLLDAGGLRRGLEGGVRAALPPPPRTRSAPPSRDISHLTQLRLCPGLDELYGMLSEFAVALRDVRAAKTVLRARAEGRRPRRARGGDAAPPSEAAPATDGPTSPPLSPAGQLEGGGQDSDGSPGTPTHLPSPGVTPPSPPLPGDDGDPLLALEFDLNLGMTSDAWDVMGTAAQVVRGGAGVGTPPLDTPPSSAAAGHGRGLTMFSPMASAALARSRPPPSPATVVVEGGDEADDVAEGGGVSPPPSTAWAGLDDADVDAVDAGLDLYGPTHPGAEHGDSGPHMDMLGGGNLAHVPEGEGGSTPPPAGAGSHPAPPRAVAAGLDSLFAAAAASQPGALHLTSATSEYSLFDPAKLQQLQSWAGPGHWKAARPRRAPQRLTPGQGGDSAASGAGGAAAGKKRSKRSGPKLIDFSAPPLTAADFDLPKRRTTNTLSAAAMAAAEAAGPEAHLLPADMHYAAADLLRLFLNPKRSVVVTSGVDGAVQVQLEGCGGGQQEEVVVEGGDWVDGDEEGGWDGGASPPQAADALSPPTAPIVDSDDEEEGLGSLALSPPPKGPVPRGGLVQAPRLVARVEVSHARKAKQVNVRALKKNIWRHLERQPALAPGPAPDQADAPPPAPVSFMSDVVGHLAQSQPAEVSLPFFFTCVLHLANEQGLVLQQGEGLGISDFTIAPASLDNAL